MQVSIPQLPMDCRRFCSFEVFRIFVCAPKFEGSAEMSTNLFLHHPGCSNGSTTQMGAMSSLAPRFRPVISAHPHPPPWRSALSALQMCPFAFPPPPNGPASLFLRIPCFFKVRAAPQKNIGPHVAHGTWGPRRFSIYILTICSVYMLRCIFFTIMGQK